ncbi:MAG TPA: tol-pal system-associated acyl-CoA thioesterase [Steroidobacteraceae bacterium]|nr:tol-pal system-associated acyl-CoA thioesterase [Steroidobacteraceae bacterium]
MSGFAWPARVYWEDTDGGGIVYYANYLRFLERARTEWLRSQGLSQQRLLGEAGILFTVVSLEIEYRAPARLDDELEVTCEPEPQGPASLRFAQRIYRRAAAAGRELLAEASVRVACLDARTMRPRRLPAFLQERAAEEAVK